MDQVKTILQALMTHRFWIICGLITVMPLGGWFTTTASMRETTKTRKDAILAKFKEAETVRSTPNPPNDTVHAGMDKLVERLKHEIGGVWQLQYDQQKELLVWPIELGDDFISAVRPLSPIEKVKFPTPPQEEIKQSLRERYRNYIKKELPKLAQIIDATWMVQESADMTGLDPTGGAFSGGSGMPGFAGGGLPGMNGGYPGSMEGGATGMVTDTGKVLWSSQDQASLMARYDFQNRPGKVPRTVEVLYAQEDLWIMSAIMQIIADTNRDATARYNAVVKEIQYINLGAAVGGSAGVVMRVGQDAGMGGGMGGMGGMPGMGEYDEYGSSAMMGSSMMSGMGEEGSGMPGMPMGSEEPSSDETAGMMPGMSGMPGMPGMGMGMGSPDPAHYRYVDSDYKPLPATTVRSAIESDAQNEEEAYLLVAKRIPIRIGVTIDQRKLNQLITACGNSKLMVEVRQVRFNRQGGSAGGMGGGMGAMMGGMDEYGGGGGGMMPGMSGGFGGGFGGGMPGEAGGMMSGGFGGGMMPGGSGFGGSGYGTEADYGTGGMGSGGTMEVSGHDKPVEIYGVIYLYNPVDVKRLRLEEAAQQAVQEASGEVVPAEPVAPEAPDAGVPAVAPPAEAPAGEAVPADAGAAPVAPAVPDAGAPGAALPGPVPAAGNNPPAPAAPAG